MMQDAQDPDATAYPAMTTKILKAKDYEALESARSGIVEARSEADRIIAAAHEEAERIKAHAMAAAEADRSALVIEYAQTMHDQSTGIQDKLTDLVMASLRRLLDPIPEPEKIAGAVMAAMAETDISGGAVLIVAPPLMHPLREQFRERGIAPEVIEVRGDPECPLESSVLRSPFGDVELGIEVQIRAIETGLRSAWKWQGGS